MTKALAIDEFMEENNILSCDKMFACVFDHSSICQSIALKNGKIYLNQAFYDMLGYSDEDSGIKCWEDIVFPEDLELYQNAVDDLYFHKKEPGLFVMRFVKKDGSIVWGEVHASVSRGVPEESAVLITAVVDITDRMIIESEFAQVKERLHTFLDSSQDMIYLKDENFRHVFANKALAEFYGLKANDLIGMSDYELTDTELADHCRITDEEVIKKKTMVNALHTINGKVYEIRKFPVRIDGNKTGIGAYIRDITSEVSKQEIINKISETNRIITECMLKPFANVKGQLIYALHEAVALTQSQYGYIYSYDENQKEFILNAWSSGVSEDCSIKDYHKHCKLEGAGIWGEVVRQRVPVIINDFSKPDPLKKGYPEGHVKLQRFMSIPIFENERIAAVIGFANKKTDYTNNDVHAMTVLMNGVWLATLKKEKEKETAVLLERAQALINDHEAIMLLIEPISGEIIEANKAAAKFYGYSKEELLNMTIQDINMLDITEAIKIRAKALRNEKKYFTFSHRLKTGEVRTVDVYSSPIEYHGNKVLFSIIFDVTEREEITRQNEYLANHDHLIGIYNRRYFEDAFNRQNNENNFPVGIILGDINALKIFNDSFGHAEGDKALKEVSLRIKEVIRDNDVFARIGGDEFVVMVTATSEEQIKEYMAEIDRHVNSFANMNEKNTLTISLGYGVQRNMEDNLDVLIKEAEAFMYNRKYYSNRSTRSNTVNVIMDTLFAKSERERNHSERVGLICEAIATKLQMDKEKVDRIRVAGFLHDIGKIGISEGILNKIGKLNRVEWETMKLHPAKGARILENTMEFKDLAEIVLSHHERYDGTGYPNGLQGSKIPAEARIITVADSFDAMANERTYRKALSEEDIINELIRCSGTQFDPKIVSTFINSVLPEIRVRSKKTNLAV